MCEHDKDNPRQTVVHRSAYDALLKENEELKKKLTEANQLKDSCFEDWQDAEADLRELQEKVEKQRQEVKDALAGKYTGDTVMAVGKIMHVEIDDEEWKKNFLSKFEEVT